MERLDLDLARLRDRLDTAGPDDLAACGGGLRALQATLNRVLGGAPVPVPPPVADPCELDRIRTLLSDAIGCVSEGFVLFDEDGRLVLCNERYRAAYPLLADRLQPGIRFAELLRIAVERGAAGPGVEDPSGWIAERLNRHIRTDRPSDHRLGDGRWYRISEHPTRSGGVVKILTDITELKRHEEALAESEERYRQLVETAPYGIVIWDGARVRFSNRSAALILGTADPAAMTRIPQVAATEFDGVQRLFDWLPQPGEAGAPAPVEARVLAPDGALREVEVGVHPFAVEGRPAWLLVLNDITQRKQAERAIHQAQKMQAIGQLAGGIAHEFNNMLTAIGGFARMARRAPDDRRRVEQCLTEIVKATERASGLTAQLLSFGRPGRAEAVKPVRVAALIEDLRRFLVPTLGERHPLEVRLQGEVSRSGGAVVAVDPGLLHQSLVNLVINARDAMPDGGPIAMTVDTLASDASFLSHHAELRPGTYVAIAVQDRGAGIEPAVLDRVFEPFFTTKEPGAGTGLGLSLVYSTVTRAGGAVEVETEPGQGTTFTVYLPAEAPAGDEGDGDSGLGLDAILDTALDGAFDAGTEEPEGLPSMAATVLLVEDEDQVREFIRLTLEDMGMRVVCAADGTEALRAFADHGGAFDLLVTDLVMSRMGGAEVARTLRRDNPDLPIVLISGYPPDNENLDDLLGDLRRVVFLHKPVKPDELADKVHALVV